MSDVHFTIVPVAEAAAERNDIRRFLNERCAADPSGRVQSSDLYDAYRESAARNGCPPLDLRAFPQTMQALGFEKKRTATGFLWLGIRERRDGDAPLFDADEFEPVPEAVLSRLAERVEWNGPSLSPEHLPGYWGVILASYRDRARRAERADDTAWNDELTFGIEYDFDAYIRTHAHSRRLWDAYHELHLELYCVLEGGLQRLTDADVSRLQDCLWRLDERLDETPAAILDDWAIDVSDLPEPRPAIRALPAPIVADDDGLITLEFARPARYGWRVIS